MVKRIEALKAKAKTIKEFDSLVSLFHAPNFNNLPLMHAVANGFISNDNGITYRKLTHIECERLQTLPDNYTEGISNTQRYKCLGNGWTVDVIAHILRSIK